MMDACIWAIDPFGLERSEVTSSSLNGNQNMDRSVSPLRLRLTSIFLPPGASIWIFGTFDIDSEQITPSDPSVAVVGQYSYHRPNSEDIEGLAPKAGPSLYNKKQRKMYTGFAVDLIECSKNLRSKNECNQAVVKLWAGSRSNETLDDVGMAESMYDVSNIIISQKGKFLVLLDMRYSTKDFMGNMSFASFKFDWSIENGNAITVLDTIVGIFLLGFITILGLALVFCVFKSNNIAHVNRIRAQIELNQLEAARRRGGFEEKNNQGATISRIKDLTLRYSFNRDDLDEVKACMERAGAGDNMKCSICLDDVVPSLEEEEVSTTRTARLLPCSHIFHEECVSTWLQQKKVCPLCKLDIAETNRWYKHGSEEGMDESDVKKKKEMYEKSKCRYELFRQALKQFEEEEEEEEEEESDADGEEEEEDEEEEEVTDEEPPVERERTALTVIVPSRARGESV